MADEQARCPLAGCDADLYLTVHRSGPVWADGTADPDHTSAWEIGCSQGHVVHLPVDDAADYHEYEESDAGRLRDLLAVSDD